MLKKPKALGIPPVGKLDDQRSILGVEWCRQVIVCVHDKQIRSWLESPLESGIQINVFDLLIVLDKCCEE